MNPPPDLALFVGRLHPLLVHLPIGLLAAVAFLEILGSLPRLRQVRAGLGALLAIAVPAAVFTATCGWLLSLGGGYEVRLLQWHKWTGTGVALACTTAALLYWLRLKKLYRICLFSTCAALVVTSHFGGSLTHGSDYLVRYAPTPFRNLLNRSTNAFLATIPGPTNYTERVAFSELVRPVLEKNCVSCHGPEKAKGGLRLDSAEALLKGGKEGPILVAGRSAESDFIKRLLLPLEHDDHMPPAGKPQPTGEEIALLAWWVDAGASPTQKIAALKPSAKITHLIEARFGLPASAPSASVVYPLPMNEVLPLATRLADELHVSILPLSQQEPWLQCNTSLAGTNFTDAELAKLQPLSRNLRWLDLAGTRITDSGLAQVNTMPNLIRLHLERTCISDAGLGCLGGLAELEYLNLYGTAVTDAGLALLSSLPKLKQLYVWQTGVSSAGVRAFVESRTDTNQVRHWEQEIEALKAKIRDSKLSVELGIPLTAGAATNPSPVNSQCPVSGKAVDTSRTVSFEKLLVAFCCEECKQKFQQDPKPYMAKLGIESKATEPKPSP